MPSPFLMYLTNMDKKSSFLKSAQEFVHHAIQQKQIGMLGRLFNDFPMSYQSPTTNITYYAVDPAVQADWIDDCKLIIRAEPYLIREVNGDLSIVLNPYLSSKKMQELEQSIESLAVSMLVRACKDVLNNKGEVAQAIMSFFDLEHDPQQNTLIQDQILLSYVSQIVIGNLNAPLIEARCNPKDITLFITQLAKLCFSQKDQTLTPFSHNVLCAYRISSPLHDKKWDDVLSLLVSMTDKRFICGEDLQIISKHRRQLVAEFKNYLLTSSLSVDAKLAYFDRALAHAFGSIMRNPATHNPVKGLGFTIFSSTHMTESARQLMHLRKTLEDQERATAGRPYGMM